MPAEFNSEEYKTDNTMPFADNASGSDDDLMWELLSLYADGEASPDEAAQVERMLRHDAEYARAYAFMRQAGSTVRAIVEIEPPAHLREAILAKTSHRVTFARRLAVTWGAFRAQFVAPAARLTLAGGALASAALLIGLYVGHSGTSGNAPASSPSIAGVSRIRGSHNTAAQSNGVTPALPTYQLPDPADFAVAQNTTVEPKDTVAPDIGEAVKPNTPAPAALKSDGVPAKAAVPAAPVTATAKAMLAVNKMDKAPGKKPDAFTPKHPAPAPKSGVPKTMVADAPSPQNVYPMMDANVQHRAVLVADAKGMETDDLNDNTIVTSHDDSAPAGMNTNDAEGENAPGDGHKIVGKLQLAKLPPTSRHILSPADVVRQVNATAVMRYSAAVDSTQHRAAEVPVMTLKY